MIAAEIVRLLPGDGLRYGLRHHGDPRHRPTAGVRRAVGATLGLNRDLHGKPTGVRTLGLVGLASALIVMAVGHGDGDVKPRDAGLVTGIGFLGAGVIIRSENGQARPQSDDRGLRLADRMRRRGLHSRRMARRFSDRRADCLRDADVRRIIREMGPSALARQRMTPRTNSLTRESP